MNEQEQAEQQRGVFILGGEGSHRGFWGEKAKGRGWGVVIILVIAFIFVPSFGWPPIVLGVLAAGVLVLITSATHNGSILERRVRRKRHRESVKTRSGDYHPYDQQRVTMLTAALEQTAKTKDKGERAARVEWARELAAMRATPDGADGMGWLQSARGIPGIAWHGPVGEDPYLSVAFAVSGQLRGMESPDSTLRKAEGFGALLAGFPAAVRPAGHPHSARRHGAAGMVGHDQHRRRSARVGQEVLRGSADRVERRSNGAATLRGRELAPQRPLCREGTQVRRGPRRLAAAHGCRD